MIDIAMLNRTGTELDGIIPFRSVFLYCLA